MKDKINIAELLKDCPQGMELDCTMYDNLYFDSLNADYYGTINCYTLIDGIKTSINFTKYGTFNNHIGAKCVIFPKGKTTWEGFVPPRQFKDGDIVYIKTRGDNQNEFIIIFKEIKNDYIYRYISLSHQALYTIKNTVCHLINVEEIRLATEEEKAELFDAIKAEGYKWNTETKTLKKLVEPKFKVGDRIKLNNSTFIYTITDLLKDRYRTTVDSHDLNEIEFERQDAYQLASKFDITTLKSFDKVLVRDNNKQEWVISLFSHCNGLEIYKYSCINGAGYSQCIPYEGNQHLLGKTDDCVEYFKTWE